MTDTILITIFGALIIWVLKGFVSFFIINSRIKAGLLADIKMHAEGVRRQKVAVKTLVEHTAKEGQKLPFPFSYNVGQYSFYHSIQKDLPIYLAKSNLVKVIKFYQNIWELDVSINGLSDTLSIWERESKTLTEDDIKHLKDRSVRIESFCDVIISKEIITISDLPDDYDQIKGPETVVANT